MQPDRPHCEYIDLRLPNGKHSGLRLDVARMVLELQREGIRYYFDLAMMYTTAQRMAITGGKTNEMALSR